MTWPIQWNRGDIVILPYVETPTSARMVHATMGNPAGTGGGQPFLVDGNIVTAAARPYRVVQQTEDVLVLFQPEGTAVRRWVIAEQRYVPNVPAIQGETLRFLFPSMHFDVTLMLEIRPGSTTRCSVRVAFALVGASRATGSQGIVLRPVRLGV